MLEAVLDMLALFCTMLVSEYLPEYLPEYMSEYLSLIPSPSISLSLRHLIIPTPSTETSQTISKNN